MFIGFALFIPKLIIAAGFAIASALLSFLLRPKQPKSARSNAPDASYGVSIPRVIGKMKLPGSLVLASLPRRQSANGKGGLLGGGANNGEKFFGTCQVLIGEGNLHGIHGSTSQVVNEPPFLTLSNKKFLTVTKIDGISLPITNVLGNTLSAAGGFSGRPSITLFQEPGVTGVIPSRLASEIVGTMSITTTTNVTSQGNVEFFSYAIQNGVIFLFSQQTTGGGGFPISVSYLYSETLPVSRQYTITSGTGVVTFTTNTTDVYNPSLPSKVGIAFFNKDIQPATINITQISLNRKYTSISDGRLFLKKIYVNDKIWYNTDDSKTSSTTQYFEFFDGRPNQSKSITLSAILGASKTPEYSGISHIVFKDLPLHEFGGDNYPTFHFEVDTSLSLTPYLLIKDLMYRCGVYFNRQLTEGQHYLTTTQFRAIAALSNLIGFQIDQQGSTPRDYVDQVTQLYDFSYYQVNQNPVNGLKSLLFEKNYDFSGGVSSDTGVVIDLERKELNSSQDRQAVPVYEMSSDSRKIASSVEVKALNVNNNYENIAISLNQFTGDSNGEIASISFALATDSADLLRLLAQRALVKSAHGSVEVTHTDAKYQTKVQDVLNVQNTNLPLMRTKRISIGANGIVQTERYAIAEGSVNTSGLLPQPDTNNNDPLPDTNYITSWFEGQRQTSLLNDILGQRVTHVIIGSTSKDGLSDVGTLVYSVDGGTTSVSTGQTVSPNALYCSIELTTTFTGTTVIDAVSVLDITVPSGTTLNSVNDSDLFTGTQNLLMIPGLGLISFGIATLTGVNRYRLSRLLWNVGQTLWDSNTKTQSNYSGFCYLMTSLFYSIPVPSTVPLGAALRYFIAQPTGTLDSSAIAPLRNNPEVLDGLCDYPRHPTGVLLSLQTNGNLQVDWYAPQTQTQFQPSPLFDASMTDAVSYTTRLRNGTGTVLATHSGLTSLTDLFTSAEIAGNTGLNVTIQGQNSLGQFMPETNLVKWVA